jgi:hypothetical protein
MDVLFACSPAQALLHTPAPVPQRSITGRHPPRFQELTQRLAAHYRALDAKPGAPAPPDGGRLVVTLQEPLPLQVCVCARVRKFVRVCVCVCVSVSVSVYVCESVNG